MPTPNPKITISSLEETIEREMTDEEVELLNEARAENAARIKAEEAAQKAKEEAKAAVLSKLGLTDDEARALLG